MGRKVRGHERPARLGAGRGLGGLFEPIPAGAGGGSSAGSSHDVSTGLDSAMSHHCTRGASDGVESRGGRRKRRGVAKKKRLAPLRLPHWTLPRRRKSDHGSARGLCSGPRRAAWQAAPPSPVLPAAADQRVLNEGPCKQGATPLPSLAAPQGCRRPPRVWPTVQEHSSFVRRTSCSWSGRWVKPMRRLKAAGSASSTKPQ